jgi:hypothetical protein
MSDINLEDEADKAGMIHTRKHPGGTEVLDGYGTSNFGIPGYTINEKKDLNEEMIESTGSTSLKTGLAAGVGVGVSVATAMFFGYRNRQRLSQGLNTLINYSLLIKESSKK